MNPEHKIWVAHELVFESHSRLAAFVKAVLPSLNLRHDTGTSEFVAQFSEAVYLGNVLLGQSFEYRLLTQGILPADCLINFPPVPWFLSSNLFSSTIIYTCKNFVNFGKLSVLLDFMYKHHACFIFLLPSPFHPLGPPDLAFPFVFIVKEGLLK